MDLDQGFAGTGRGRFGQFNGTKLVRFLELNGFHRSEGRCLAEVAKARKQESVC
jgi:hypothetical protein